MALLSVDKILTISARDYCEMNSKRLEDYEAKGIHYSGLKKKLEDIEIEAFAGVVPPEAEVVVDFIQSFGGFATLGTYYASGTALIPKQK